MPPKRNYNFEKRQKEMAKQQKREEKKQKKIDRARNATDDGEEGGAETPGEVHTEGIGESGDAIGG